MKSKLILGLVAMLCAASLSAQYAVSLRNGASDPAQCQPKSLNIFYNTTTTLLKSCTASNTWTPYVQSGGSGGWPLLAPNGTTAAPSYSFTNFPTLGLYANTNLALAQGTGSLLVTGTTTVPTALTAALVVIAGNIDTGSHSYQVTFVTAGGETSAGTTSNTVANDGTHAQNTLTSVPLGGPFVTQRKIYRNTVAAPTVYKLQQTIANNTSTAGVQDNTADAGLGATIPASNTAIDTRLTVANTGQITATGDVIVSKVSPLLTLTNTAATFSGFLAQNTNSVMWSVNQQPLTFTFTDTNKAAAVIQMNALSGSGDITLGVSNVNNTSPTTALHLDQTSNVGFGNDNTWISAPASNVFKFGKADAASPAAQTLAFQGSRGGTDTNTAGVLSLVQPSLGTGTAVGDQFTVARGLMQATGTTQHVVAHAVTVCESKTLSNTSATVTTIATIGLASNSAGGLHALITLTATDGTNFDSETQDVTVSFVNKAAAITVGTALITTSTAANNSGSATIGATVTGASPTISLKVTPIFTTIVPSTVTVYAEIFTHGAGAVACQ